MKKLYSLLILLVSTVFVFAQDIALDKNAAKSLVQKNYAAIGISQEDAANAVVTSAVSNATVNLTHVYLNQVYKGYQVYNQIKVLAFRNGNLVSNSGSFLPNIETRVKGNITEPVITAQSAVQVVARIVHAPTPKFTSIAIPQEGYKLNFGDLGMAWDDVTAQLVWMPVSTNGKTLVRLAWQVNIAPNGSDDYWSVRIDAANEELLDKNNFTVHEAKDHKNQEPINYGVLKFPEEKSGSKLAEDGVVGTTSPAIVNNANYNVIPYPVESPIHGSAATVANPWTLAGAFNANAVSLKWHNDGATDYSISRGNNVWATEDRASTNTNNGTAANSTTTPDPLNFLTPYNFALPATNANFQQSAVTNLFYWNNIMHDMMYNYGFNEVNGNFQANNQGRGGAGNDHVMALAQSGAGIDNANFSTPADGGRGRMRMYLFDSNYNALGLKHARIHLNSPAVAQMDYESTENNFSTMNRMRTLGPVTGQVVWYNDDPTGTTHDACTSPPANTLTGKIALINRGNCNFSAKVKNAQLAGAIGAIVINNVPGIIIMGGTDNTVTIPAVAVTDVDGASLAALVAGNLNVTIGRRADGDFDNGVITHEYGHGVSNRLTGGPAAAGCLSNAEQGGEGWSDYIALMMTTNWATATPTDGATKPRAVGAFVANEVVNGYGIRTFKYCTDMTVNPLTYDSLIVNPGYWSEVHNLGELWTAALWDMTWNIIQQEGINSNLFNTAGTGGNSKALKLVIEGLRLQPCNPGYIDARDAIFKADSLLYNGAYHCAILNAFARRGMGVGAKQGSADVVGDETASKSNMELKLVVNTNFVQQNEGQQIVFTNKVTAGPCAALVNLTLTDTIPANTTWVSGGTYNAANRTVTFTINQAAGSTQTYPFTVSINSGSYFPTVTLLSDAVPTGAALPNSNFTATSSATPQWTVTSTNSYSSPSSYFATNPATAAEQYLTSTTAIALPSTPPNLNFAHNFNTESNFDGGMLEISTDGGSTWTYVTASNFIRGGYNAAFDATSALNGKSGFTGSSNGWIKSRVNLSAWSSQSIKLRFRMSSDAGVGGTGWYVDDINIINAPVVEIFAGVSQGATLLALADTVVAVLPACTGVAITTQPVNVTSCPGSNATFSVVATGNPTYQWQVSTTGCAGTFTNINGATSASYTVTGVTSAMNGYAYKVVLSNPCSAAITSSCAVLTVSTNTAAITTNPTNQTACIGSNATFTSLATGSGFTYQWQVSTNGGTTWADIAGATSANYTVAVTAASQNGNQYRVHVVSTCSDLFSTAASLTVTTPASINTQPVNASGCPGTNRSFTVVAAGTAVSYQWQLSTTGCAGTFANIVGETNSTLNLNNLTLAQNGYAYRVIVTNTCGTVTSSCATLSVNNNTASITTNPTDQSVCAGSTATFTSLATGSGFTYQWQKSTDGGTTWNDVAGATSANHSFTAAAGDNNTKYRVHVVASCSDVFSTAATLTVNNPVSITTQPANATTCETVGTTFTAAATGTSVTYQWQVSTTGCAGTFTNIAGATSATYTVAAPTLAMNGYAYRVVITNMCGSVNSNCATLTVNSGTIAVTTNPANTSACVGSNATFTAVASGPSPVYQWQVSTDGGTTWTDIAGANTLTLNVSVTAATMNNNRYRLKVTNSCNTSGVTSTGATLTVNSSATISAQPQSVSKCSGSASFSVTATGATTYQWQVSVAGGAFTNIAGATAATYTIAAISSADNGNKYRVVVGSANCGTVNSTDATLTVLPAPTVVVTQAGAVLTATVTPSGSYTYQWFHNGNALSGANSSTYTMAMDSVGNYKVSITNAGTSCTAVSADLNVTMIGSMEFSISPSPTSGLAYARFFTNVAGTEVRHVNVYDSKGALLKKLSVHYTGTSQIILIDLTTYTSGIYRVVLSDKNEKVLASGSVVRK